MFSIWWIFNEPWEGILCDPFQGMYNEWTSRLLLFAKNALPKYRSTSVHISYVVCEQWELVPLLLCPHQSSIALLGNIQRFVRLPGHQNSFRVGFEIFQSLVYWAQDGPAISCTILLHNPSCVRQSIRTCPFLMTLH